MTKNIPFFPILHVFAPLNDVRAYIAWSWKTTLITWIFLRGWYPTSNTSGPPPPGLLVDEVPRIDCQKVAESNKRIRICQNLGGYKCLYKKQITWWRVCGKVINVKLQKNMILYASFCINFCHISGYFVSFFFISWGFWLKEPGLVFLFFPNITESYYQKKPIFFSTYSEFYSWSAVWMIWYKTV